jgi:tyrosyl-tRNA synthetase
MLTSPILRGPDMRKMSKSYNNTINVNETSNGMYAKIMSIPDQFIPEYFDLVSIKRPDEIQKLMRSIESGANPMEIKKALALDVVGQYWGAEAARKAEDTFYRKVQKKEVPIDVPEVRVPDHMMNSTWVDLCFGLGLVKAKGEIRRLMRAGSFHVDQVRVNDTEAKACVAAEGTIIRIRKFNHYKLVRGK